MLFADLAQVRERTDCLGRLAGHVQPERVVHAHRRLRVLARGLAGAVPGSGGMCMPRSPITNARTSFECGMPRDLSTYIQRLRLRFSSLTATCTQVSMSEETIASVVS